MTKTSLVIGDTRRTHHTSPPLMQALERPRE